MMQLELFPQPHEEVHERKIQDLAERQDKLRKSLHAKNNTLQKKIDYLENRLSLLEAYLCKGKITI